VELEFTQVQLLMWWFIYGAGDNMKDSYVEIFQSFKNIFFFLLFILSFIYFLRGGGAGDQTQNLVHTR
jgi:hypothetical protein